MPVLQPLQEDGAKFIGTIQDYGDLFQASWRIEMDHLSSMESYSQHVYEQFGFATEAERWIKQEAARHGFTRCGIERA